MRTRREPGIHRLRSDEKTSRFDRRFRDGRFSTLIILTSMSVKRSRGRFPRRSLDSEEDAGRLERLDGGVASPVEDEPVAQMIERE
jgi:hypothetical protein